MELAFFHKSSFCQNPVSSGMLNHAHNLYLQLWANTGVLGLLSIAIFSVYLWTIWRSANLPHILQKVGLSVVVYLLLINCFDVSLFHWPVTQMFTGIFLAIPMSRISSTVDQSSLNGWFAAGVLGRSPSPVTPLHSWQRTQGDSAPVAPQQVGVDANSSHGCENISYRAFQAPPPEADVISTRTLLKKARNPNLPNQGSWTAENNPRKPKPHVEIKQSLESHCQTPLLSC